MYRGMEKQKEGQRDKGAYRQTVGGMDREMGQGSLGIHKWINISDLD